MSQQSAPLLAGWQWLYEFIASLPGVRSVGMSQVWSAPPPRAIPEVVITEYYMASRLVCFTGHQSQLVTIGFTTSGQQKGFRLGLTERLAGRSVEIREVVARGESVEDQLDDVESDFGDFDEVDPAEFEGVEEMTNPVWTHPKLQGDNQQWLPSSLAFIKWLLQTYMQIQRVVVGSIKSYDGIYQVPECRYNVKQRRLELWFYEGEKYQEFYIIATHVHELEQNLLKVIQKGQCPLPPKPATLPVTVGRVGATPVAPEVRKERADTQLPTVRLTDIQADAYDLLKELCLGPDPRPVSILLAEHYASPAGGNMEKQVARATASNRVMELQRKQLLLPTGKLGNSRTKLYQIVPAVIHRESVGRTRSTDNVSTPVPAPKIQAGTIIPAVDPHGNGPASPSFPAIPPAALEIISEPLAVEPPITESLKPADAETPLASVSADNSDPEHPNDEVLLASYSLDGLMVLMTVAISRLRSLGWEVEPVRISRKIG